MSDSGTPHNKNEQRNMSVSYRPTAEKGPVGELNGFVSDALRNVLYCSRTNGRLSSSLAVAQGGTGLQSRGDKSHRQRKTCKEVYRHENEIQLGGSSPQAGTHAQKPTAIVRFASTTRGLLCTGC